MFFCLDVTDHCTLAGSAASLLFVVTAPLHHCLAVCMAWDPLGFHWSYAANFGVLGRGANCTKVHLARLIAGVQIDGLDVHDISLASSADVLGYAVSPANSYRSGTGKGLARIRSVRSLRVLASHELSWRSAIVVLSRSLTPASKLRGRPIWLLENHGLLCAWNREIWGMSCLLRNDWTLRWLDVWICTDVSEKGFAFAVHEGRRELASEAGRISVRTRFNRSSRSVRARSRGFRSIALEVGLEFSTSDENEVSLARKECRADFPEVSLQLLDTSKWKLAAHGGFFREENITVLGTCGGRYPPGLRSSLTILRFCTAFSNALNLCAWFQVRFCPVVQMSTIRAELPFHWKLMPTVLAPGGVNFFAAAVLAPGGINSLNSCSF